MKLYVVTANVHIKDKDGWIKTLDIPTFFLSKDIQGIVSEEHAKKIVEDMLNPTADSNIRVYSTIVEARDPFKEAADSIIGAHEQIVEGAITHEEFYNYAMARIIDGYGVYEYMREHEHEVHHESN